MTQTETEKEILKEKDYKEAYFSISKEARLIEKENIKLKKQIKVYDEVIKAINKAIWRIV